MNSAPRTNIPDPDLQENFQPDTTADFRRLWHAAVERSWIALLCLIACIGVAAAYIHRAPVLFASTATIQVQQDQAPTIRDNMRADDQGLDFLQTIAQSIKTRPLLESIIQSNNLAAHPRFLTETNKTGVPIDLVEYFDKLATVKLRRGTRLIDVSIRHSDPQLTALLANSIVDRFISENSEQHVTSTEVANESLLKEAARLRKKLQESEGALQAYMEQSKATSLQDSQNTVVAELKELSTRVTEAKSATIKLESDYNQVISFGTNIPGLMTLSSIADNHVVKAARTDLAKAESDFAALRQRYKEKHPKYIQAQTQILALQADLRDGALKAAQTMSASLEAARASQKALEDALKAQEATALELNKLAVQYSVLSREVESDRALYDSILKTMKETSVSKEIKPMRLRVVQPAYSPNKPVSPRKAMILAAGAMGGLCLGFMIIFALNFLDSSVKTVDDAEALLNLPVLSTVGEMRKARKHPLLVLEDPKSPGAESFRTLRTSLSMLGRVEDRRVFLFTSALPQEGKTFCSCNYAASLAQLGLKTLLIDSDLRRPNVEATLLGEESQTPGVTNYLTGQKTLPEIVRPTKVDNLFFASAGTTAPNPAELLAQGGLRRLIKDALEQYDRVVVDSAPVHAVSDTLSIVDHVQTVCLVIRAAHTSSRSVLRCIQLLAAAKAPLSGLILNRMPMRRGLGYGTYGAPYYDYNYHGKYSTKGVYGT